MHHHDDLTLSQKRAVELTDGPLLVLAGPGSGKTRVITRRIARIIEKGVDPSHVLAITFTNKAAGEMAQRVATLLPGARVWVSTFHRFCARLLRYRADVVGLKRNFTILDTDDQRRLIRGVIRDLNYDSVNFPADRVAERISRAKNDLVSAEAFRQHREERIGDLIDSVLVRAYAEYQRRLVASNAVDFDDLLLYVVQILEENPEIRGELDDRYRYVLVDEYQDTNLAQYRIVAALSRDYPNLCVTGDPDQSIYAWRGARIENILRFEADYPRAAIVRLEENFRSTQSIVRAADSLIAHNVRRKAKSMTTANAEGTPVAQLGFENGMLEAEGVAREIQAAAESGHYRYSDVAIFYRVNALSREFEQALSRWRVPFQVASGFAFYDRAEIRDLLAYLRLLVNPQDRAAFLRIVNEPVRGLGKKSLQQLVAWADAGHHPLLEAAARAEECPGLSPRAARLFAGFANLIAEIAATPFESVRRFLELVVARTAYAERWRVSESEQDRERAANVDELITAAAHYDAGAVDNPSLEGFLETTALVSDVDSVDGLADRVTLMTLHSAKGLEFPIVYIVGVEQGYLPHQRAVDSGDAQDFEEERRLLFVGMTRARQKLTLTRTLRRDVRGQTMTSIPSPFLREIGVKEVGAIPIVSAPRPTEGRWDDGEGSQEEHPDVEDHAAHHEDDQGESRSVKNARAGHSDGGFAAQVERPSLMTGAELLAGAAGREADAAHGFAVGMSVRHPRYGVGRVIKVSGFAKNRMITVEFSDDGRSETFIAGKNPLQPVGAG